MMRHKELEPRFVTTVPRELESGVLYVSMEYGTALHRCCCGCGHEVVTPLTPTDWTLTFNGEAVSLWPSVGNWNLPCQSHYVIKGNRVLEAGPWNRSRIDAEIKRDKAAKAKHYGQSASNTAEPPKPSTANKDSEAQAAQNQSPWAKVLQWLRK